MPTTSSAISGISSATHDKAVFTAAESSFDSDVLKVGTLAPPTDPASSSVGVTSQSSSTAYKSITVIRGQPLGTKAKSTISSASIAPIQSFIDTSSGSQTQQKTSMRWASMRGKLPITTSSTQPRDLASTVVFMSSPDASASGGTSSTFAPSHSVGFDSVSRSIIPPTTASAASEPSKASTWTMQVDDSAVASENSASIVQGQTSSARNVPATSTFSSASGHTGSPSRGTESTSTNSQYQETTSGQEPHTSALTLSEISVTAALSLEASSTYTELKYPKYSSGGGYPEWMPTKTFENTAEQQSPSISMPSDRAPDVWNSSSTPDLSQTSKLAFKSYDEFSYHETSAPLATTDLSESIVALLPTPTPSISFDTMISESIMPSSLRDPSNDYEASRTAVLSSDRAESSEQTIATSITPRPTVDTILYHLPGSTRDPQTSSEPDRQAITPSSSSSEGVPHNSASPAASTTVAETVASTQTMNVADDFVSPRSQESSVSTMAITSSFINDSQVAIATDSLWLNATSSTGSFFVETNSSSSATSSSTFPASETVSATELSSSESPLSASIGQSVSSASSDDSYTEDSGSTHYKPASVSASPTVSYDAIALATTSSSTTSNVSAGTSVEASNYTDSRDPESSASFDTDIEPSQTKSSTIANAPDPTVTDFEDIDGSVTPIPDSSSDISSIDDRQTPSFVSSPAQGPSSSFASLPGVADASSSDSRSFETSSTFTGTTEPYPSATHGAIDTDEHFIDVHAKEANSSSSTVEPSGPSSTREETVQTVAESTLQSSSSFHISSEAQPTIAEMDTGSMPSAASSSATLLNDANYTPPSSSEARVETATIPSSSTSPTELTSAQKFSYSSIKSTSTFHAPSNTTYTSLKMETNSVSAAPSSSATISSSSIPEPLPTPSSPSPSDDLGWTETSTTPDPYSSDVVAQDLSSSSTSFSESLSVASSSTLQSSISGPMNTASASALESSSFEYARSSSITQTDSTDPTTESTTMPMAESSASVSSFLISGSSTQSPSAMSSSDSDYTSMSFLMTTDSTSYIPQTSTVLYCPRPSSDCNNKGYLFAYYGNEPYGNDVANMDATYTKQMTPTYNSTTNQGVGIYGSEWSSVSLYGSSQMYSDNYFYLSHKGYFFAQVTGYYNFTIKDTDDIAYVWMGDAAYSGWTGGPSGGNYVAKARCCWPPENTNTTTYWMEAETYVPFRIVLGQQDGSTSLGLTITAPDGTVILQTGKESDYVVQYSCDGTAPPFPDWGSKDFQMFPSRHAIVGQSADPFIMLSSRCDDAFDGINEFRLVTSSGT
ncbi:hypothetical protein D6D04_07444 [Aureobasidium pullulans]|nr:hypothetical protein D6D04_07444 [Aureobasidium pullulans]